MDDSKKIDKENVADQEMLGENNSGWSVDKIKTLDIILDPENPRLNFDHKPSESEIIEALFEQEKVMELIISILDKYDDYPGGFYPGESIIVIKNDDKIYKVLEGNRRVCSAKCLLKPDLAPSNYRSKIIELISKFNINTKALEFMTAQIAPDWKSAQKIITSRHSDPEIRKWSYISKWRRDYNLFQITHDTNEVSRIFGEDPSLVKDNLKNYAYIRYILEMPEWTDDDRKKLSANDLESSILEWHMSVEIQNMLGIKFDDDFNLDSTMDSDKFRYIMKKLASSMFLDQQPKITTRTDRYTFKSHIEKWINEYDSLKVKPEVSKDIKSDTEKMKNNDIETNKQENKEKKSTHKTLKPDEYFESLSKSITVEDTRLRRLTFELTRLTKNDMKNKPISGVLLTRALIESALLYRIKYKQLDDELKKRYNRGLEYITLQELLNFSIDNVDKLFKEYSESRKVLNKIQSDHRPYMNSIVHGDWMDPTALEISGIAGTTRKFLITILTDSP